MAEVILSHESPTMDTTQTAVNSDRNVECACDPNRSKQNIKFICPAFRIYTTT